MTEYKGWLKSTLLLLLTLLLGPHLHAKGYGVTYQGRILDREGRPLKATGVQFYLSLHSPGTGQQDCLLFKEQFAVDMDTGDGGFSIIMGSDRGVRLDTSGLEFEKLFNPDFKYAGGAQCSQGYTRKVGDSLILKVAFNAGAGLESLEPIPITANPIAMDTLQVAGISSRRVLRVDDDPQSIGLGADTFALSPNNFNELVALLNGTSKKYAPATDALSYVLPATDGANGQVLATDGAGGLVWQNKWGWCFYTVDHKWFEHFI